MEWIERNAAPDADVIVYAGDFNTESGDLPHRYSARGFANHQSVQNAPLLKPGFGLHGFIGYWWAYWASSTKHEISKYIS